MSSMVEIFYFPATAPASTPADAIDYQIPEPSAPQAGGCRGSVAFQTSKRSAPQAKGRRCSIVSQSPRPVPSAVADSTPALGHKMEVTPNGRVEVTTFASRCSPSSLSSLPGVVKISERRNSLRRPKKSLESSLSSGDEGEGFSGSDTSSEAGSA